MVEEKIVQRKYWKEKKRNQEKKKSTAKNEGIAANKPTGSDFNTHAPQPKM